MSAVWLFAASATLSSWRSTNLPFPTSQPSSVLPESAHASLLRSFGSEANLDLS